MSDLEQITKSSFLQKTTDHINYKVGLIGGIGMGLIVFSVNYEHGLIPAAIAGLKQATYIFLQEDILQKCVRK